ncbi:MAG TPA: AraC family transcriptional regulator, partial [Chitinophagaceae bacterium]|nr:AraC family transcriptional regulator [Chitinophagaceae bacterium]
MEPVTIKAFYKEIFGGVCSEIDKMLDADQGKDIGHFNVFDISELQSACATKAKMPYNRRTYYKISLIKGKNRVEYADRVVDIQQHAILFATPKLPYSYTPQDSKQAGHFCVFTREFLSKSNSGLVIDEIPIFKPGSDFVYEISASQATDFEAIFRKMHLEIGSDYPYKYDLLRNYVIELIHNGQKLKPLTATGNTINAASRISSLFIELLERQFPIETNTQTLGLRTAKDYADTLQVHVNHLNKVLKEFTGRT